MFAFWNRWFVAIAAVLLFMLAFWNDSVLRDDGIRILATDGIGSGFFTGRKLLDQEGASTDRIGEGCSKDEITVHTGQTAPLPNGIPTYTVEVLNLCASGCSMANIHLRCGWFSSARLVNPRVFRRLRFNDCLVNDGRPLHAGASLSFEYANTYSYPLTVSSASCS